MRPALGTHDDDVAHLLGALDDLGQVEQDAADPRVRRHGRSQEGAVRAGDVDDPVVRSPPKVRSDRRGPCVNHRRVLQAGVAVTGKTSSTRLASG